jgi:Arc/MetJ-type ribon-helix-helix transcriptional regulator
VTTRLDPDVVDALDRAVAAGLATNRAAVISTAVHEWLATHGEDAIAASYRRRYAGADHDRDELISQLASFSVAACLASNEH